MAAVSSTGTETLHVKLNDPSGLGLSTILLWINEVPQAVALFPAGATWEGDLPVTLAEGRNRIQIAALNKAGVQSLKDTLTIEGPKAAKPKLYVLAVGVSKYGAGGPLSLHYAAKDATDIYRAFQDSASGLGLEFVSNLTPILDEMATKDTILKGSSMLKDSRPDDMVVVFLAGHGATSSEGAYFMPHDATAQSLAEKGLKFDDVDRFFDGVAARRRLVLFDACHSGVPEQANLEPAGQGEGWKIEPGLGLGEGVVVRSDPTNRPPNVLTLHRIFDLFTQSFANLNRSTGAFAIAACSGYQTAVERPSEKNGLFTFLVLDALRQPAKAEFDQRPGLSVTELRRHVFREMGRMVDKNAQQPTSRQENLSYNFRVK